MNQNVEEIRERCETNTDNEAKKGSMRDEDRGGGRCSTREVRGTEEAGGRGIIWRKEDYAKTRSSTTKRTGKN